MFTGIIQETGRVAKATSDDDGLRLTVSSRLAGELRRGDSISVSGVCLTALEPASDSFRADVMAETLQKTTLGQLREGARVNLELPIRADDPVAQQLNERPAGSTAQTNEPTIALHERLGGHVVQGHVDRTAEVTKVEEAGFSRNLTFSASSDLLRYVIPKGSIALDGVALTVVDVDEQTFSVSLIPETLDKTTLSDLKKGDLVNVEVDVLAKYLEKLVRK
jgi:riboflavin synthase